ncbi:GerAB/ArcD/ProY family transporter [Paenibacillus sp. NPDC056579]|uniref:GerAB/ArcD/ProY family transporter n=1 Tax=Paenibacillus sp. NPDC056579 TaxID=3345871 RepID=UPI003698DF1B
MKAPYVVSETNTIPPYLVLFLVFGAQVGLEYLSFQRKLANTVGQDSWIVVIIAGALLHVSIRFMFSLLNRHNTDIVTINKQCFGSIAGGIINTALIVYALVVCALSVRLYAEIVRLWIFPDLGIWKIILVLLILIYYIVSGGFRVLVGFFVFAQLSVVLIITYYFVRNYYHPSNLLPVWTHSAADMAQGVLVLAPSFMGVEALLFYYPFIKKGYAAQLWAHLGNAATVLIYLMAIIFCLMFYSLGQLMDEPWPILGLFKFVELPFMERVEFIGASVQVFRLIPLLALYVWIAIQSCKLQFNLKKKIMLPVCLATVLGISMWFQGLDEIQRIYPVIGLAGITILFIYVPLVGMISRWLISKRQPV